MPLKRLTVFCGKSMINFVCKNGDIYDSMSILTNEQGKILNISQYVNTDHTEGYRGGILMPDLYYARSGLRKVDWTNQPLKVLRMFDHNVDIAKIHSDADLTEKMKTLPSRIPNPNHDGKEEMSDVQCHPGNEIWDWSHGCLTWLNYGRNSGGWDRIMYFIPEGEIIEVEVIDERAILE
jgi:hypothetical protein